ncbi:MAG: hypothetical protein AAGL97_04440 [Pseudomonadota bacterium]
MRKRVTPPEALLICFVSQEDEQSDLAALSMVQRISNSCSILLIEDVHRNSCHGDDSRGLGTRDRVGGLKSLANRLGLEHTVTIREMNEGIRDLRRRAIEDVIVFNQPRFALDRQTQVFRKMERALISIPNRVLYTPADKPNKGRDVVAFARHQRLRDTEFAERLTGSEGKLRTLGLEALAELAKPQSQLRLQIQSQSPAMILIEEETAGQMDALYSRLAAVLSTPILVITQQPT